MRLTTWNVNGIRNPFSYPPWNASRSFSSMFDILESDIVVMQELKIQRKDLSDDMVLVDGWDCYFSLPKQKKGYSGVGVYTRNATCAPIRAEEGLLGVLPSPAGIPYRELLEEHQVGGYPSEQQIAGLGVDPMSLDAEGRCVVVEFPAFVLFGVYSPANSNGLRDDFRYGFICALECRIRNLVKMGKNVILVGDLNVTRHEFDSGPTLEEIRKNQMTRKEYLCSANRRVFNQLIIGGEVIGDRDEGREQGVLYDTTREFHPDRKGMYTQWETKVNARPGNFGSRIDFVLVSAAVKPWIKDANIQEGLLGSDHCPVFADFEDEVLLQGREVALVDIMSPSGFFEGGKRMQEWKIASTPLLSAKRMPEFDKRRSIRSMFAPSLQKAQVSQLQTSESTDDGVVDTNLPDLLEKPSSSAAYESPRLSTAPTITNVSKRKAPVSKVPHAKRSKTEAKPAMKGQQSLRGFFQAKATPALATPEQPDSHMGSLTQSDDGVGAGSLNLASPRETSGTIPSQTPIGINDSSRESQSPSPRQFASQLASAEQAQQSWGALFAKPAAPMCEHDEPCKTMQTKKKGSNQGRSFWMCARPLGPSGEKERGTEWRCATFIWCSDWQPKKEGAKAISPVK